MVTGEKLTSLGEQGLERVMNCAKLLDDGVFTRLLPEAENLSSLEVKSHRSCYSKYTRRSKVPTESKTPD